MSTYPKFKAAAVHSVAPFLDLEAGLDKACDLILEAGRNGADLIAFPETYLPGYPYWIWSHTPKQAQGLFAELFRNAIELPSDASRRLGDAARRAGAWVVMGLNERDGGTLYNTQAYFDPTGRLVARHRKLQPTHAERTVWGRGDGRDVFVLDTEIGKLGGLICFEHTMDLNRYALATLGEQVHVSAWPGISAVPADAFSDSFEHHSTLMAKHHAIVAQTYVVLVQGMLDQKVIDRLGATPETHRLGGGLSGFIGPDGHFISEPHRDSEAILYADLDLGAIPFAKNFVDSVGHYARPDVFKFRVDRSAQTPLTSRPLRSVGMYDEATVEDELGVEALTDEGGIMLTPGS